MVSWDRAEWVFLGAKTEARQAVPQMMGLEMTPRMGRDSPLLAEVVEIEVIGISPFLDQPRWQGRYMDLDRWAEDLERIRESCQNWHDADFHMVLAGWHIDRLVLMIADKLRRLGRPWNPFWWAEPFRGCVFWDPCKVFGCVEVFASYGEMAGMILPDLSLDDRKVVGTWSQPGLDARTALRIAADCGLLGPWARDRLLEEKLGDVAL